MYTVTLKDGGSYTFSPELIKKWEALYPDLNIIEELVFLSIGGFFEECTARNIVKKVNAELYFYKSAAAVLPEDY